MSQYETKTHARSLSEVSRVKLDHDDSMMMKGEAGRTESPDNDSAFSDTVSMLSSESSASSGGSGTKPQSLRVHNMPQVSYHLHNGNLAGLKIESCFTADYTI